MYLKVTFLSKDFTIETIKTQDIKNICTFFIKESAHAILIFSAVAGASNLNNVDTPFSLLAAFIASLMAKNTEHASP